MASQACYSIQDPTRESSLGYTQKMARDEIKEKGCSTIIQAIRQEIQAGHCACEIKNPAGACCLGHVTKVVNKGLNERPCKRHRDFSCLIFKPFRERKNEG